MAKHFDDSDDSLSIDDIANSAHGDRVEDDRAGAAREAHPRDESDNAADDPEPSTGRDAAEDRPKKKGFFGRHKILTTFLILVTVIVGGIAGFGLYLNSKLSDVQTYVSKLDETDRVKKYIPPAAEGTGAQPVNILLLGADKTSSKSVSELVSAGQWDPGAMRSDTIMMIHIPADRSHVYLVSLPRDSWVPVPGYGNDKINAAFSYGGPDLAIQTVEQLTNIYIDHVMIVDWEGFKGLTDALGGVSLYIPGQGNVTLNGEEALTYVRSRKALPNGDFDRIKRQQNFLRQIMQQTLDSVAITNVGMLVDLLTVVTNNVTVDASLTPEVMRGLAWDLRAVKSANVTFMTVPNAGTGQEGAASVVYIDDVQAPKLWDALREDTMPAYLYANEADTLGDASNVN